MLPKRAQGRAASTSCGEWMRAAIRRGYRPSHVGWFAMVSQQERRALRGAPWTKNAPPTHPARALDLATNSSAFEP